MSKSTNEVTIPRSVRQKRILDRAADDPEATIEEIAAEIPSATPDHVESVLEEYGDPADQALDAPDQSAESPQAGGEELPALEELPDTQSEILELLQVNPEATQQTIAEQLDVSAATISNRVNAIPGFEWSQRHELLEPTNNGDKSQVSDHSNQAMTTDGTKETIADLSERVTELENRFDDYSGSEPPTSCFSDPELAHKVVHACMQSETISEDEELRILQELLAES